MSTNNDVKQNVNLGESTPENSDEASDSILDCNSDEASASKQPPAQLSKAGTEEKCMLDYGQLIETIKSTLISTKNDIKCINEGFNSVVSQTIELEKALNAFYYEDGIKKLCYIIEKIKRIDSEFTEAILEEMVNVLTCNFQATMITPTPGDKFNSVEHERKDSNVSGETIVSCSMVGWKIKDRTIIRAIVETE